MINILISEDNDGVAQSIGAFLLAAQRQIQGSGAIANPIRLHRVSTMEELHEHEHDEMDVILLDLRYPDSGEMQTLAWLSQRARQLPPVIVITALIANDDCNAWLLPALAAGADDFFPKSALDERGGHFALFYMILKTIARAARRKTYVNAA